GALNASGTIFNTVSNNTQIVVNGPSGRLAASNSSFALTNVILNSGSNETLTTDSLATVLTINSAATINISQNDFSKLTANGVVAMGDPSATINLPLNYWGTTVPSQISAKIFDHADDVTKPSVNFQPFVNNATGTLAASKTVPYSKSDQTITLTATVSSSTN